MDEHKLTLVTHFSLGRSHIVIDVSSTTFGIILQQDLVWTPNEREDDDDDDDD